MTPRMVVSDAAAAVEFLHSAFDATGMPLRTGLQKRALATRWSWCRRPASGRYSQRFFTYTSMMPTALIAGRWARVRSASEKPWDTPYGDRRAMVRDVFGNLYQIATRNDTATP